MRLLLNTTLLILLSMPVMAEEFTYSPEDCEFQITLPGEPQTVRRCHDKLQDQCHLVTGYTQVFGELDATMNIYARCNASDKNYRKDFTQDLMRTTLLARPGVDKLEAYDISFKETDNAFMGAILGAGKTGNGNNVMLYMAQIWVGDSSIFTVEGELIGEKTEKADKAFAKVLRSLHHVDWEPPADEEEAAEEVTEETAEEAAEATEESEEKAEDQ